MEMMKTAPLISREVPSAAERTLPDRVAVTRPNILMVAIVENLHCAYPPPPNVALSLTVDVCVQYRHRRRK
jgi:hypothetical protein